MLEELSNSLDYIEENLQEDITIEEIAKAAYTSKFHYQRMFFMLTGSTVFEYIRRCRLTLAAQELAAFKAKVIDVALKYGYDSPESFSKAYGISPSQARKEGAPLPGAVQQTWDRIFSEWFPSTGYEHAEAPELEVYPASRDIHASDQRTEIWIPVVKK
ncbi:AraC family transcriptional regulator [Bacillus atrophaeus]|uniref:AraC family transcriptional regulator n=1 Tax=Bacillus atrophaeus TaxID=1452 RepID=UPI0030F38F9F